jgi:hypothetical protein
VLQRAARGPRPSGRSAHLPWRPTRRRPHDRGPGRDQARRRSQLGLRARERVGCRPPRQRPAAEAALRPGADRSADGWALRADADADAGANAVAQRPSNVRLLPIKSPTRIREGRTLR